MRIQFYKEVIQTKMLLLRFQSPDVYYMYGSGPHHPAELALAIFALRFFVHHVYINCHLVIIYE